MSTAEQPNTLPRMTYEEFLDWADEDTLAEWVDGEVVMTSPASARHQQVKTFLMHVLIDYVDIRRLGLMFDAPFQMKLPRSGREPDILFISNEHADWLKATYLDGPADLAIEIISSESMRRDREQKYYEYQAAGVCEYWLIDPNALIAEFYQLSERGSYQCVAPDERGIYHSAVLDGFWLQVAWLWQDPLPRRNSVLLRVVGRAYLDDEIEAARRLGIWPDDE